MGSGGLFFLRRQQGVTRQSHSGRIAVTGPAYRNLPGSSVKRTYSGSPSAGSASAALTTGRFRLHPSLWDCIGECRPKERLSRLWVG